MPEKRPPKAALTPSRSPDLAVQACEAALAAAAALAYSRTLSVPALFDDNASIAGNPTIRHMGSSLLPPAFATVGGRPILNLSLAVNYAVSGTELWSYHALNLAIHIAAGLVLFGIVRRTLAPRAGAASAPAAFCVALLWELHPLLTESVTYVIQRAESLMGLLYLLTLYAFIRGAASGGRRARAWQALCVASCLLGMGTKEVMVSAPLIVLLYDRTFLAGSFRDAWRLRWRVYLGLAATWLVLPFLVLSTHGRGGTAGFGAGVPWWSYALTQLRAIVLYLRLSVWPHPLVFDYGSSVAVPSPGLAPCALAVGALLAATAWALVRRPAPGFLGACFFAILAPSSSVVPVVTETMAEHRMYLPLIPVVALAVSGIFRWLGRGALPVCLVLAACLFWATWMRNEVYATELGVWSDTVASLPSNERAQNNLGNVLANEPGRLDEAISGFAAAVRLQPAYADAHFDLGVALAREPGRLGEAVAQYEAALRLEPDLVEAHNNLGYALMNLGRTQEAITQFEEALRLEPGHTKAHYNLGNALSAAGRVPEAIAQYEEALRQEPEFVEAHFNLGNALGAAGRTREAIDQYGEALRLRPDFAEARYNLGKALDAEGRTAEAVAQYEAALRLKPGFTDAHFNLGSALAKLGRTPEAIAQFEETLRLDPDDAEAHLGAAVELLKVPGRAGEAADHLRAVLRLQPGNVPAARMLSRMGLEAR
jgi:tetratricopeptide (TPR) repeat protein